ncbi:Rrf2 family transcriptional regulator, partial [Bacillus inaquosorum]|nr:Rrf2 family transcriptional regulator [Bacillus inaquosorum]
ADISLLEVYRAVQKQEELFAVHENPNPKCPVGKKIQNALDETFEIVQKAMENE